MLCMASDETIGEQLTHTPDKVWRVIAVMCGMFFILGRLYYVQEQHNIVLSELVDSVQTLNVELKSGLESLETQTQTYQEGARQRFESIEERLN